MISFESKAAKTIDKLNEQKTLKVQNKNVVDIYRSLGHCGQI